mmetsp:Transcript_27418/g.69188  ORF Transcript_27418/g.69188 Transcript_27418/m.69188 type:complete len:572 (+) Transcript_27418:433-2148(+)
MTTTMGTLAPLVLGLLLLVLGELELVDDADADRVALVADHEASHLREVLVLLDADGARHLDADNDRVALLAELGVLLLDLARLLVEDGLEGVKGALLDGRVDVEDAGVASADDGLEVEDLNRGVKPAARPTDVVLPADDEPVAELVLLHALDLHLDVVARQRLAQLVLVDKDLLDDDGRLVGQDDELLPRLDGTRLELPHDARPHVLVLVGNGKPQGHVEEPGLGLQLVQVVEEGGPRVPGADVRGHLGLEVCSCESRDGHKVNVRLDVEPRLLEERLQLTHHLVVPLLVPHAPLQRDRGVVHLVDPDNEHLDARRLGQDGVLPRLPPPVEPGLKLSLADRDDEHRHVGLRRPPDHVGHKVLVARRVEDRVVLGLGLKGAPPALLRLPLVPLLVRRVHAPRELPALPVLGLCLPFILLHRPLIHLPRQVHDVARDRALPGVDVPDEADVEVALQRLDLLGGGAARRPLDRCAHLLVVEELPLVLHLLQLLLDLSIADFDLPDLLRDRLHRGGLVRGRLLGLGGRRLLPCLLLLRSGRGRRHGLRLRCGRRGGGGPTEAPSRDELEGGRVEG